MSGKLFGTDGIRGVAGRWPLTPEFVRRIGWCAGRALRRGSRPLLLVRDTRASGPALLKPLAAGLSAAGVKAVDGGVASTPAVAVLVPRLGFAAGAVISASHNPARFNGIKFFGPAGAKLPERVESAIEKRLLGPERVPPAARAALKPFPRAGKDYLAFLRSTWPKGLDLRGVKLAIDCANGATHRLAVELFRSLGAELTVLAARPDGRNINRGCGALHPGKLAAAVRRAGAHLGAAFDGDGDRAIFVDETGRVRDGDSVLLAAARDLKARGRLPKDLVVVTVMANLGLYRALDALGLRAVETPVGDKYVWQAMAETGAALGGEPSGHVIFRDFLSTGDGLLTALQMLGVMRRSGRPFSALTSLYVRYPQVLLNVPVKEKRPLDALRGFGRAVDEARAGLGKSGRVIVRYSGTEPLLRIMVEGPALAGVKALAAALAAAVRREGL